MRRKAVIAFATIVAALSFAGTAFASHLIGELVWANPSEKVLTINADGREWTFIAVDDAVHSLANLKPGSKVAVSYTETEGKRPVCHHVFPWPIGG